MSQKNLVFDSIFKEMMKKFTIIISFGGKRYEAGLSLLLFSGPPFLREGSINSLFFSFGLYIFIDIVSIEYIK